MGWRGWVIDNRVLSVLNINTFFDLHKPRGKITAPRSINGSPQIPSSRRTFSNRSTGILPMSPLSLPRTETLFVWTSFSPITSI